MSEALRQAADQADEDGAVPPPVVDAVQRAMENAEAAESAARQAAQDAAQALAAAAPGIGAAARTAPAKAAQAVRAEAALMRAWGLGSGELERMPFGRRALLAERLRTGRLARWAELIGRFRQMAGGERARKVENATGELVGVTLGNDLSRVIPSELANLGLPELRAVFAVRYAAGELMLYDSQGEQATGQGAIIACVDTSHSMYEAGPGGITREAWAKACALALLDQARHAGRDFVGILFSAAGKLKVFRFPADQPAGIGRTLDFAETFLGGGTIYQAPLTAAVGLLSPRCGARLQRRPAPAGFPRLRRGRSRQAPDDAEGMPGRIREDPPSVLPRLIRFTRPQLQQPGLGRVDIHDPETAVQLLRYDLAGPARSSVVVNPLKPDVEPAFTVQRGELGVRLGVESKSGGFLVKRRQGERIRAVQGDRAQLHQRGHCASGPLAGDSGPAHPRSGRSLNRSTSRGGHRHDPHS